MSRAMKSVIAVAAVAAVAVIAVLVSGGATASADEVRFQTVSDPGPQPFTPPADVPKGSSSSSSSSASPSSSPSSSSGSSTTDTTGSSGSSPSESTDTSPSGGSGSEGKSGAFGGTGKNAVCDREKLIAQLTADPDKLSAWAEAAGIDADPQTVADYIRGLRPATLTEDTQVTNHSYSGGSARAYQAILTKGTAVLVDEDGKPVARCRCGNPLSEPVQLEKETRCFNCPANYQPPPPCEGKCYRPEPDAPPAKKPGTPVDPIVIAKSELEKCRQDKGDLKQCETEYEKARQACDANPLNPACDSSVCFDAIEQAKPGTRGCASYIDGQEILAACLPLETAAKQACLKRLRDFAAKCAADPSQQDCKVDPKIKAFRLRQQCISNPGLPHCGAVQDDCTKNPEQFRCDALKVAINDAKQKCQQDPALPVCKNLPKTAAPTLRGQDESGAQEGDQGTGDQGTGDQGTGGQGTGGQGTGQDSGPDTGAGDSGGGQTPGPGEGQQPGSTPQSGGQ